VFGIVSLLAVDQLALNEQEMAKSQQTLPCRSQYNLPQISRHFNINCFLPRKLLAGVGDRRCASRRAHSIAEISVRRLAIIIQIQTVVFVSQQSVISHVMQLNACTSIIVKSVT